jgi:hypothetical protein
VKQADVLGFMSLGQILTGPLVRSGSSLTVLTAADPTGTRTVRVEGAWLAWKPWSASNRMSLLGTGPAAD